MTCFDGVGGGVVDRLDGAHLAGVRALLRVEIGDDDFARDAAGAIWTALPPTPPAPMMTRWSSGPTWSRAFFSADRAVMPEQV